uniref:GDSL esterase/lipase 5-like n=1 Tax=Nicotiana tabacum TaxID=4097 RepID=A0A1S3Z4A2_TOBAC|nr:PREDICTED: GDSL esterase/lipase 5-like [Nicotiana tabacum]
MGAQTGTGDYVEEVVLLDHILELIAAFASPFSKGINGVNFASGGAGVVSTTHPGLRKSYRNFISNDYMGGLTKKCSQQLHGPEEYLGMVVGNLTQELYEKGARKFGFLSLSPLGCLPALRALNPGGGCFEAASDLALAHNNALQHILQDF